MKPHIRYYPRERELWLRESRKPGAPFLAGCYDCPPDKVVVAARVMMQRLERYGWTFGLDANRLVA